MLFDSAELSLPGDRQQNQDSVGIVANESSVLLIVVDGMGGHAGGDEAAAVTLATLTECFAAAPHPVFDPQGFLMETLGLAHDRVVDLGREMDVDQRPRATCATCLVQDAGSYWAHVGDSRVYQLRAGAVRERSRDHSHVELLLREGVIEESDVKSHPLRNYVEYCLGGDEPLPEMSVTARKPLVAGDVLMVCTDGLWSGVDDVDIAALLAEPADLEAALEKLAHSAVEANSPHSDNTTAAALRWNGD